MKSSKDISWVGLPLWYSGGFNTKGEYAKPRLLHPVGFIYLVIYTLIYIPLCLFTDETLFNVWNGFVIW